MYQQFLEFRNGGISLKDIARIALEPGMVLGKDVYTYRNELLFPEGTVIDANVIAKLARHSIIAVMIKEEEDFAVTHFEKIRVSKHFREFETWYATALADYKQIMNDLVEKQVPVNTYYLLEIQRKLESLVGSKNLMLDYLYNMLSTEDELTHMHCLNSALIAGVFADWLVMSPQEKECLVLSAFFYDIGKLKLPYELLWKPGKLTDVEYATIKTHPIIGYEIARTQKLDMHITNSILMHHERCDGSGYPSGLKKDQIDIYARHIAIIDSYEAMTSPRAYREALTPLQVIEAFQDQGLERFDTLLLRPILKRIADSQIGLEVKLNDDSLWEIFVINPSKLSRPILRNSDSEVLNLTERPDLKIVSLY